MQRTSREPGQGRQERAALLQAIALKRNSRIVCSDAEGLQKEKPKPSLMADELEDSSDEDPAGKSSEPQTETQEHNVTAKPALRRLRKLLSDDEVDSIAKSLGALDVNSGGQTTHSGSQTPAEETGGFQVSVSLHQFSTRQEACSDNAEAEVEEGLCLGDNSEFKLDPAVSRTLYAHQAKTFNTCLNIQ